MKNKDLRILYVTSSLSYVVIILMYFLNIVMLTFQFLNEKEIYNI